MKSRYAQQIRTCVNEWFKEHTAQFFDVGGDITHPGSDAPPLKVLQWRKPGTSIFFCRYLVDAGTLAVWGDIGEAVYRWSQTISWKFLAGCDLEYFAGKCCASEKGRDFNEWSGDRLYQDLKHHLEESEVSGDRVNELLEQCGATSNAQEWMDVAGDFRDVLGDDYFEYATWGEVLSARCIGHWVGIQMATGNTEAILKRYEIEL